MVETRSHLSRRFRNHFETQKEGLRKETLFSLWSG